jgi:putative DNA methylase
VEHRHGQSSKQWTDEGPRVAKAVADAVGAGKAVQVETVDFNDPNRPKTCLEVDFPILPVNQVAAIEGNAGKPIYQMSKWWARRRSSVFRSLLLSASMKAPEDTSQAAKAVWDVYYANHQKKRSFANLKVADIFMGGGTTVVEGSRLGMQMFGNDLNPVAWFVVKTELADVKKAEVEALLADIEAEVKPQIMPFYACNGPHGERGTWTRIADGKVMGDDFDPLALKPEERKAFKYEGPEIIYVFWSKHGPCQVTGCGHRTPVMSSPVLAVKELSIKVWPHKCPKCKTSFDIEESEARMAPDVTLVVADGETPFAPINAKTAPSSARHAARRSWSTSVAEGQRRRRSRSRCSCIPSGCRARSRRTRRASPTAAASPTTRTAQRAGTRRARRRFDSSRFAASCPTK